MASTVAAPAPGAVGPDSATLGGGGALIALVGALIVPALAPAYGYAGLAASWLISAVLLVAFCALVGVAINGRPAGVLIDNRNRVSLSKFQAAAWSVVVLSALITAVFARIGARETDAAGITLPAELLAAMGISATSLVAAPAILSLKSAETPTEGQEADTASKLGDDPNNLASVGKVYARSDPADAEWFDMFRGEEVSNAASPDLSKVQQFLITVAVLAAYGATLWAWFAAGPDPKLPHQAWLAGFPAFSPNLAWLVGISSAGYLAYKAAPHGSTASAAASGDDDAVG